MKNSFFFAILMMALLNVSNISAKGKAEAEAKATVSVSNVELNGIIFDKNTNESLAGVVVLVNGQKVYTDFDGNFTVKNVCNGVCELKISMISYEDRILQIDTRKDKELKIALKQR
jgi:hypothetical protein